MFNESKSNGAIHLELIWLPARLLYCYAAKQARRFSGDKAE